MTSSEGEGQPPPRKRSKTSANSEDAGSKKARGRPRVDTQDETAADRRRTQIRLAQRAYRQRKETTISSLKQQNDHLQSIIEQMNNSFLRFNDSALKSGLLQVHPSLAHELKIITENFVTLAKNAASEEIEQGDEENGEAVLDHATVYHDAAFAARALVEDQRTTSSQVPVAHHTDIGWGYTAMNEDISLRTLSSEKMQATTPNFFPPSNHDTTDRLSLIRRRIPLTVGQVLSQGDSSMVPTSNHPQPLPFGLVDMMRDQSPLHNDSQAFTINVPTPEVTPPMTRLPTPPMLSKLSTKSLKPIWTYSHDETTFARRLTRSALETGFHLLSTANLRPAALNYVFRLSLPYISLDGLRERFKMLLARGTNEDLDCWDTPFIHLGGAGTHYPRKDGKGNIVPIPNSWTVRSIGPHPPKRIRAENTADPSQSHDLQIDLTGFEGEWFDAHDVQGYLEEEKGCHIDPKDSFAEVYIEVDESTGMTGLGSVQLKEDLNLDLSSLRRHSHAQSESPDLSNGTSSAETLSNKSTPQSNVENMFGPSETFGLDMANAFNDMSKFNEVDITAIFDQPLGLDLAPGFGPSVNDNMTGFAAGNFGDMSSLEVNLMTTNAELPVIRQKQKKAAFVDVSKLIDEIIKHGVCLGRAPGFRRKDVDMAFQASLIHAF